MYQDAGYGENWDPAENNARRIDPFTRSCAVLGSLFAIGFVLIIIVVLSLIPIYISHKSSTTNNNIQTSKIIINNYYLQLQSPFNDFDPQTVLSNTNNLQALQAALTSMIQKDSVITGSIVQINTITVKANRKRRQTSNSFNITFDLNVINNKPCSTITCLNQFQSHCINSLSNSNKTTSSVAYQEANTTQIDWLYYRLPQTIQSDASFIYVDPKTISSLLSTLLLIDENQNQPSIENSTSVVVT